MAERRGEGLDLNFDSLTDVITNLVGGLIMLIVLVVGATQARSGGVATLPPADNKVGGEQPMDRVLEKIRTVQDQAEQVDQELRRMEARLPELAQECDELKQKTQRGPADGARR